MKYLFRAAFALPWVLVALVAVPGSIEASHRVHYKYIPRSYDEVDGSVTVDFVMEVAFIRCSHVAATVMPGEGVEYDGVESWSEEVSFPETIQPFFIEKEKRPTFTKTLDLRIPPNDTSSIVVRVSCGDWWLDCPYYFVNTEDSIEYWRGRPQKMYRPPLPHEPKPRRSYRLAESCRATR